MARLLIINAATKTAIAEAVRRARETPVPLAITTQSAHVEHVHTLTLSDKAKRTYPPRPKPQQVPIDYGFMAMFSFEDQPAGLVRHLSISVDAKGKLPRPEAVAMIAREFGFQHVPPDGDCLFWSEEFEPGHFAFNVVEMAEPRKFGVVLQ